MKPKSWKGEQTTIIQHVEQTKRKRADSLSEARIFRDLKTFRYHLLFGYPFMPYWNNASKNFAVFWVFHRLFLKQDLERTKQNQRMMLYTGPGIGKHPTLIGLL